MSTLAVDIGLKRTGLAFAGEENIPLALDTVEHETFEELQSALLVILSEKNIQCIVFGLPLLPSGQEGEQAQIVRDFVAKFPFPEAVSHQFLDERHTSAAPAEVDNDASAACALLQTHLDRKENC